MIAQSHLFLLPAYPVRSCYEDPPVVDDPPVDDDPEAVEAARLTDWQSIYLARV